MMVHIDKSKIAVDWADGEASTGAVICYNNEVTAAQVAEGYDRRNK